MRQRLSTSPVGPPLTYADNFEIYECENFLLEGAVDQTWKAYWAAHVMHFHFQVAGQNPYTAGADFFRMRELVTYGLERAGYSTEAARLASASDEASFNRIAISQYTADSDLFEQVNRLLRQGHADTSIAQHPLVPWIAHLNAVIRNEREYPGTSFRGAELTAVQQAQYVPGQMFIWTSFTSLSMSQSACLEGNTLFEVTPRSALSVHGKRAPRVIAAFSEYPEEEEVLLPVASAFRVVSNETSAGRTRICLDLLDHN